MKKQKQITHYNVADNSDAFREWLNKKGIEHEPNGHFTSIPLNGNDIFQLGADFGVYKYQHLQSLANKQQQD